MTPYRIIVNNAHNFCAFNFWTSHAVRNILTTKISRFTVVVGGRWREGGADV